MKILSLEWWLNVLVMFLNIWDKVSMVIGGMVLAFLALWLIAWLFAFGQAVAASITFLAVAVLCLAVVLFFKK